MTSSFESRSSLLRGGIGLEYFLTLALLILIYYLGARLGLFLEVRYGEVTPIWPPSGIALAVFLIGGRKFWPMILIGEFFIALTLQQSYPAGLIGGLAQLTEALLAWQLLSFWKAERITESEGKVLIFLFAGVIVPPIFSALLGASSLHYFGYLDRGEVLSAIFTWWLGDALGILVLTPFLTVLLSRPSGITKHPVLLVLIPLVTAVFCFLVVALGDSRSYYLFFLLLPCVVASALYFGTVGAGSTVLVLTATVFLLRPEDLGRQDFLTAVRLSFIGTCAFTGYLVAGLVTKRRTYTDLVRRQNRYMSILHDVALEMLAQRQPAALLDTIITKACAIVEVEDAIYCQWDEDARELQSTVGCGIYADNPGSVVRPGEGLIGQVWQKNSPLLVNEYQQWSARNRDSLWNKVEAIIGVPVKGRGTTDGVLALISTKRGRFFDADDLASLNMFADLAALALQNASSYAQIKHQLKRRILAEKALAASERTYREIFNATSDALLILEKDSGGIIQMNHSATTYAAAAASDPDFFSLFFGNAATSVKHKARKLFHHCLEHEQQMLEFMYTPNDGESRWLEITFKKATIQEQIRVLAVIRNIDLHKRAESELKQLQTAIEHAVEDVMITDINGTIRYVNPAFERTTGYCQEEVIGKKPSILKSGRQKDSTYKELWSTISQGRLWSGRLYNRCKDGSLIYQEANIAPIGDAANAISGYVSVKRDITEEKKIRNKLFQAQKMEAIGTLSGGIAHDFNNILFGILGRVSLMATDLDPADPHLEHMRAIEEYIKSATSLTKQLLGVGRGGRYAPRPVDLRKVVKESVTAFGRTKKEIDITIRPPPSPVIANVDRQQIEQVLLNIYVNAWQAMPDGGRLCLTVDTLTTNGGRSAGQDAPAGPYGRIRIEDSGIGMDESTLQKIFDPFFTTKEKSRGTGLGLASAYGIIRRHDGFISASSTPGKGTIFTLLLPASEEVAVEKVPAPQELVRGSETVLMVDDETMILDVGSALLQSLGYSVITAGGGRQAIEIFAKRQEDIDLVLLDLIMPGMSGAAVFDLLRSRRPDLPILLSSGYARDGVAEKLLQRGCCNFIQKPFNMAELSQALRAIFEKEF